MKQILLISVLFFGLKCGGQNTPELDGKIIYHINENVKNSTEDYFIEIQKNWEDYLSSNQYVRRSNELWNYDGYPFPDYSYVTMLMDVRRMLHAGGKMQCSTIAIVPVKNDYYLLRTVYTKQSEKTPSNVEIRFIISVYAKKKDNAFQFYSSTAYHKEVYENYQAGSINYIIHPMHSFNKEDAAKMNAYNLEMSKLFEIDPIQFDYVVTNDTRDLSDVTGLNLFSYSYQPIASGGMADGFNNVIFAGNNSAYYPHEVVHLYTRAKYPSQYHTWVDEGIAALLGGSTGYDIEWHWEKLRQFLIENPDYKLEDLSAIETLIPNGEFMTDFRYAVGALICQRIIDRHGMAGIFTALQAGRTEENYFEVLEELLDLKRADFEQYVRTEIQKISPLNEDQLKAYKY